MAPKQRISLVTDSNKHLLPKFKNILCVKSLNKCSITDKSMRIIENTERAFANVSKIESFKRPFECRPPTLLEKIIIIQERSRLENKYYNMELSKLRQLREQIKQQLKMLSLFEPSC